MRGAANADALEGADVVVLAVPYDGHDELVKELAGGLAGKTVISCVNPLGFDKQGPYGLDVERSAAESAAAIVPDAHVVGAFHHVSAPSLWGDADYLDHEDVLVCGDDADAKQVAIELARSVTGRDGVDAGRLRLARQLEPLTAVLISINKRYKTRSGIADLRPPHHPLPLTPPECGGLEFPASRGRPEQVPTQPATSPHSTGNKPTLDVREKRSLDGGEPGESGQ